MLKQQFIDIVSQPNQISLNQLNELETLINEYPFFETAHLLYINALNNHNHLNYSKQLRQTALVVNSRTILYNILHQKAESKLQQDPTINTVSDNSVNTTNQDFKVVYINTTTNTTLPDNIPHKHTEEQVTELDIIKDIENKTETPEILEENNIDFETEISKGLVQSYVETDIIKTPELDKKEKQEPLSFIDWLNRVKKEGHTIQPLEGKKEVKTEKPVTKSPFFEQNQQIINKIIESDPGKIKLSNSKFYAANIDAKQSLLENEHLVTETLAKIYALQGNISKAIRAYEILSLKFPQKSVYFASLIEKFKNNK